MGDAGEGRLGSSFRDPDGFMFTRNGSIYRQVNQSYKHSYDMLTNSGLYNSLVEKGLLIPHKEVDLAPFDGVSPYKILAPRKIPFITYPYEWCFSQLKDAALLTLDVLSCALDSGMILKDSSAYNIQFEGAKPIFIDTLSFAPYAEGQPWNGYRQFCQHFLAPLALMSYVDPRLGRMLASHIDGVPIELASKLLPPRSWMNMHVLLHIHLHSRAPSAGNGEAEKTNRALPLASLKNLIQGLKEAVKSFSLQKTKTTWSDYYDNNNYTDSGSEHKKTLVQEYLAVVRPALIWDLGSNIGVYSRLVESGLAVSMDFDPVCVELNYARCSEAKEKGLLPLVVDLSCPSPAIGFSCAERMSLMERGPADAVMALALIHHLCIANNVPLSELASFFACAGNSLIIEFVPKSDSQVQRLLSSREDIFSNYTRESFEAEFSKYFSIERKVQISGSERYLYLMRKQA